MRTKVSISVNQEELDLLSLALDIVMTDYSDTNREEEVEQLAEKLLNKIAKAQVQLLQPIKKRVKKQFEFNPEVEAKLSAQIKRFRESQK